MTKAMHTPGPWTVGSRAQYSGHRIDDMNRRSVAVFPACTTRDMAEQNANARLIAAAPTMAKAIRNAAQSAAVIRSGPYDGMIMITRKAYEELESALDDAT